MLKAIVVIVVCLALYFGYVKFKARKEHKKRGNGE